MLSPRILRYGSDAPLPERLPLRAGPLALIYENGDLRSIRLGEREIVRRIYVAVRDRNWGTVAPRLSQVVISVADDSFHVSYDVAHIQGDIAFDWRGEIRGDANGMIHFSMDGMARTTFLRNRIGFCVLHPPDCANARARIEHSDGSIEEARFPQLVAPQRIVDGVIQPVHPFAEMRAISHEVADDCWAAIRLAGEIFEMEDQRNWIDGSFKTYGTPLRLPYPAEIAAGTRVQQAVTLSLDGWRPDSQRVSHSNAAPPAFAVDAAAPPGPLPRLGLGIASHGHMLTAREQELLRALNLAHLRVDVRLSDTEYVETLRRAAAEARALKAKLEIALHLTEAAEAELQALAQLLAAIQPDVAAWLIFHAGQPTTPAELAALARRYLSAYDPSIPIGGGTNIYFTDLNRAPTLPPALDPICYSINPQVHAFDNASLVETCAAIAATVASAMALVPGRSIAVTPITLKPRFNPVATAAAGQTSDRLPATVDPRQMALLGAGWTLASLKYLAESGVASATYYETTGWHGVMETEAGAPLPDQFHSIPGSVFPLYHILADVTTFGGAICRGKSNDPLRIDGLALIRDGHVRILLANLTDEAQSVAIYGLAQQVQVRLLDETNAEAAMRRPEAFRATEGELQRTEAGVLRLELRPHALARVDGAS